jgi:hypothetical protein
VYEIWVQKCDKWVKNQFCRELSMLLGREIFLYQDELEEQRVFCENGNFLFFFFIMTFLAGKLLNRGHLVRVLLHFIPFTECEGPMLKPHLRDCLSWLTVL